MGVSLIYCADGNPTFAAAAVEAGWIYGARLPGTVYQTVQFADQDWKNPDRRAYMVALAKHKPHMATVLDIERESQLSEALSWAEEAASHVRSIVMIPKVFGMIPRIPGKIGGAKIILGYSVPTAYGSNPVPLWEWVWTSKRRPVHLLGGSPQAQMRIAKYLNVVSADGNMAHQQAHHCRTWRRERGSKGHWVQLSELGYTQKTGANLQAFRLSLNEIKATWESIGC